MHPNNCRSDFAVTLEYFNLGPIVLRESISCGDDSSAHAQKDAALNER